MHLHLGGVRGTNPVAQPDFMKYGGETTSFLVEGAGGERVLIDAGTGVRELGHRLETSDGRKAVLLLMTHYHLDHVTGLPSLGLIYRPEWTIEIAAPAHDDVVVSETMSRIMDKPFWPLQLGDLQARLRFRALDGPASVGPLKHGGLEIRWCPVHHPGGCTAYRIDEPATGTSLVVATDMEWGESTPHERADLEILCATPAPAGLLIADAQYAPDEYEAHRGWGHSTWREIIDLAARCGVQRLLLTHHDPRKDDADLDRVRADVRAAAPFADLARERMMIEV